MSKEKKKSKSVPIEDFNLFKWNKRRVYIVFDADKWDKWNVLHAEARLWICLKSNLHANCRVVNMTKQLFEKTKAKGIDDLLTWAKENSKNMLQILISRATTVPPGFATLGRKISVTAYYIAKYIIEENQIISLARGLFAFKDGFFKFLERADLIKHIASELSEQANYTPTSGLVNEVVNQMRYLPYTSDKGVNPENMHNVKNGILKLNAESGTVEFLDHNPGIIFTFKAEVAYKPNQDCTATQQFLDEVIPDKNHQKLLLEALGFAMFPALRQKMEYTKMIAMYGKGSNGKTILQGFCIRMIGADACGSTSLDQINGGDKFQMSSLYQKRANFCSENEATVIKETKALKSITSGKDADMVDVEFKFSNSFKAKINPIMLFAVNKELSLPAERTFALERRLVFIDFPNTFSQNPKPETDEKKADNRLENSEFTQPIVDGLLSLIVETVKELIKRGRPWDEGVSENLKKAVLRGSHVERYIHERIELDPEAKTASKEIHDDYVNFCIGEGMADEYFDKDDNLKPNWSKDTYDKPCKRAGELTKRLLRHFKSKIEQDWIHHFKGKKDRAIKGIKLKVRQDDEEETVAYPENSPPIVDCTPEHQDEIFPSGANDENLSNGYQENNTPSAKQEDVVYWRPDIENTELEEGTPTNLSNNDGVPNINKHKKWTEDKHIEIETRPALSKMSEEDMEKARKAIEDMERAKKEIDDKYRKVF